MVHILENKHLIVSMEGEYNMKLKLQGKLLLIIISLQLIFGIVTIVGAKNEITNAAIYELNKKLDGDLNLGYSLLDNRYSGDWVIRNEKLYKGDALIGDGTEKNASFEIVDEVLEKTNSVATIFIKNENVKLEQKDGYMEAPYVRVSTNVKKTHGSRAVGTKLSKKVADVIEEGKDYTGEANVAGKIYQTKYTPIKNKKGEILGIWFVGVEKSNINDGISKMIFRFAIISIIFVFIGTLISIVFIRNIVKKIRDIVSTMTEVEEKNLNTYCKVKSNDEIGDIAVSLNNLTNTLRNLIENFRDSTKTVAKTSSFLSDITSQTVTATDEVARAIEEISKGATEQAKDMENSTYKISELASEIEIVAKSASQMNNISHETNEISNSGLVIVETLTEKSKKTNDATMRVSNSILEVDTKAQEIESIIGTIGQIAQQTNLLALNASIEAARAGEYGRGFSVVAEEIGNLAKQSEQAVNDINNLIEGMQTQSKIAVDTMIQAKEIVKENNKIVDEAGTIFNTIINSVKNLTERIYEVEEYSNKMNNSKDEIISIIENLSAVSEETSASTQEISASTEEQLASIEEISSSSYDLAEMAKGLEKEINQFKL